MAEVIDIHDLRFDGPERLVVEAVVDQMVLTQPGSDYEPAEWGPALCRGSMYFSDEDLVPATDAEFKQMLGYRVDDWAPVDLSDFLDD
jgi:hypothetical protein